VRRILPGMALTLALLPWPAPTLAAEPAASVPCSRFISGSSDDIECFELEVPTWHDGRDRSVEKLAVVILRSSSSTPEPDPVVYLAGGPGGSAISSLNAWVSSPIRLTRDLILVEQRGTRFADPHLACPELASEERYVASAALMPEEHVARLASAAAACGRRLVAEGVDLAAYSTAASADDLDLVRQAFGVEQWNLYGESYGTRLGLEILRRHPDGVRSAVFDSAYPPDVKPYTAIAANHAGAFAAFFASCRADAECVGAYGDLEPVFWSLVDRLNAHPDRLSFPTVGGDTAGTLTGDQVVSHLAASLSSRDAVRAAPAWIAGLAAGNIAQYELNGPHQPLLDVADGVHLSVQCAERLSGTSAEEIAADLAAHPNLAGFASRVIEPAICPAWPVPAVDQSHLQPVTSEVPVLLVAGELDPITPPAWADRAASTLSRAVQVSVHGAGHGPSVGDPCVTGVVAAFIADPAEGLDDGCARAGVDFRTDIALSAGVPRAIVSAVSSTFSPPVAALVAIGLVVATWLVAAAIGIGLRPGRRSAAWWVATVTAVVLAIGPLTVGLTVRGILAGPEADVLILGLPSWAGWMLWLPWLATAMVGATALFALAGWIRREDGWPQRVGITLVALAGLGAVAVLGAYGFVSFGPAA